MNENTFPAPAADSGSTPQKTPDTQNLDRYKQYTLLFGSGTVLIGVMTIIGIYFVISPLTSIFSQYISIAFSSACILIVLGLILAMHAGGRISGGRLQAGAAAVLAAIIIIGIIELPMSLSGSHFFIEELLFQISATLFTGSQSHMSPMTVALVIALSTALLLLVFPRDMRPASRERRELSGLIGTAAFLVSFTDILSYLFGTPFLYQTSYTPIALPTVIGTLLLATGLICAAGPDAVPLRFFAGTSVRARLLRTFIPLIIAVIVSQNIFEMTLVAVYGVQNALVLASGIVIFSLFTMFVVARVSISLSDTIEQAEKNMEEANEALRTSEALLNQTQEITKIGGWEYEVSTEKFHWTDGVARIYEAPIIFDKDIEGSLTPFHTPEDAKKIRTAFYRAVNEGEPYDLELPFVSARGIKKWIRTTARVERVQGNVERVYGNIVDVSERRQAELVLHDNEDRLNRSQQIGHTGNWEYDLSTGKIWGSDEAFRIYGIIPAPDHEIPIDRIEACIPDREAVHQALIDLINDGKPYHLEFTINPVDGSPQRILASIADVIYTEDEKSKKIVGVIFDITNLKLSEKALKIANQKLHLMNIVAWHDIQNKLTGVRAYLELSKELVMDEQVKNFILIEEEVLKVIHQQIVNTREYQEIGISPLQWLKAADLIHNARMVVEMGSIEVLVEVDDLELFCDPLMNRVFHHLLDNTIEHGRTATRIEIGFEELSNGLTLFYTDNGVGIPDDRKRDLFTRDFGKTYGFDLFFVHDVLEIYGMGIAETGSPGNGVRLEISVPKGSYRFPGRNHTHS
jgi:signal transduction histidine kinase